MRKTPLAALIAGSVLLSGCTTVHHYLAWLRPHHAPVLAIKPLETGSAIASEDAADRAYRSAVAAIDARDYGLALDRLQLAREQAPNDVRVLNAMAVVYDKLGRFDLSTRFYAEAETAAPGSPIVEANIAYSKSLQQQYQAMRAAPVMQAAATPPAPAPRQLAQAAPAPKPMLSLATPVLAGRPLTVVDAAGALEKAQGVRVQLAALGWSVMRDIQQGEPSAESRIVYPAENRTVALALAKTLPFRTTLSVCQGDCRGLTLILGENARWAG